MQGKGTAGQRQWQCDQLPRVLPDAGDEQGTLVGVRPNSGAADVLQVQLCGGQVLLSEYCAGIGQQGQLRLECKTKGRQDVPRQKPNLDIRFQRSETE